MNSKGKGKAPPFEKRVPPVAGEKPPRELRQASVWLQRQTYNISTNRQGFLKYSKDNVMGDIGGFIELPIDYFRHHALPEISGVDLFHLSAKLVGKLGDFIDRKDHHWNLFSANPSQISLHEDTAFSPLTNLFDLIVGLAKKDDALKKVERHVQFTQKPKCSGMGERSNTSRPDAIIQLIETTMVGDSVGWLPDSRYFWADVAALFELRKVNSPENRIENLEKMSWSSNHAFVEDPCRRSLYAFTIEDFYMRIYGFSRAGVIVSTPFDFLRDHEILIHVFLSIAFSTKEQLGYNPKIERLLSEAEPPETKIQYAITIKDRRFCTTDVPLSDYKADLVVGRATRVSKAFDIDDPSIEVALRAAWLPIDDAPEEERLETLRSIMAESFPNEVEELDRYFLNVEAAGFNTISRGGQDYDDATTLFARAPFVATNFYPGREANSRVQATLKTVSGSARTQSKGAVHIEPPPDSETGLIQSRMMGNIQEFQRSYYVPRRLHYIAFKEIGLPLGDVATLHDFFFAVEDAIYGLRALHRLGFVHRDVSTGNILVFWVMVKGKWRIQVKLSDLEYMRPRDDTRSSAYVKTGTLQFIPTEILRGRYIFWKDRRWADVEQASVYASKEATTDSQSDALYIAGLLKLQEQSFKKVLPADRRFSQTSVEEDKQLDAGSLPTPFFNALHDVESLFWIPLYFISYHNPEASTIPWSSDDIKKQLLAAYKVFSEHNSLDTPPSDRESCFTSETGLANLLTKLHPAFNVVSATMQLARFHLQFAFCKIEQRKEFPKPYTEKLSDSVYIGMATMMHRLAVELKPLNISVEKVKYTIASNKDSTQAVGVASAGPSSVPALTQSSSSINSRPAVTPKTSVGSGPPVNRVLRSQTKMIDDSG